MKKKNKLSVVLATRNEEANIGECLKSVQDNLLTPLRQGYEGQGEIIVFDEKSDDKTVEIAEKYGAKVKTFVHTTNFHQTKQKAIDAATGEWVLQLDADERVSPKLGKEITAVVSSTNEELLNRVVYHPERSSSKNNEAEGSREKTNSIRFLHSGRNGKKPEIFQRHQRLIEEREGHLGKPTGEVVAFFIPRVNFFVGKPLLYAGVYPDGVIRLIKQGKARLPAKSVHEVMEVDGEVGWLFNDLEHHESPTLHRYIERANRYTDLTAKELKKKKIAKSNWQLFRYSLLLPAYYFLLLYIRHRGYKDGMRGFLWSFFSALHHALAYWKFYVEA